MSDYTPTEARVCIDFCNAAVKRRQPDGSFMDMEDADAAFSRWLAARDAEVAARSIKTWVNRVRSELDATRAEGINLGRDYLQGLYSALQQAADHAARIENDLAEQDTEGRERTLGPDVHGVVYERTKATSTRPAGPWVPVENSEGEER